MVNSFKKKHLKVLEHKKDLFHKNFLQKDKILLSREKVNGMIKKKINKDKPRRKHEPAKA